jgi:hypothetical protein
VAGLPRLRRAGDRLVAAGNQQHQPGPLPASAFPPSSMLLAVASAEPVISAGNRAECSVPPPAAAERTSLKLLDHPADLHMPRLTTDPRQGLRLGEANARENTPNSSSSLCCKCAGTWRPAQQAHNRREFDYYRGVPTVMAIWQDSAFRSIPALLPVVRSKVTCPCPRSM